MPIVIIDKSCSSIDHSCDGVSSLLALVLVRN